MRQHKGNEVLMSISLPLPLLGICDASVRDLPKAVGMPSQMIAHFGLDLHPFLLT